MFILFSCDDGIKFDNPNDRNSDAYNPSDTEPDNDSDETDTISENDDESENPSETDNDEPISDDSDSDSTPDGADSIDDSGDSEPDESDSDDDSADSVPDDDSDSTDPTPDESDSTPDEDADTDSGDSTPDQDTDTDTAPTTPCDPNPCSSVANSTGACNVSGTSYSCGCNSGYFWNDGKCKRITLGNICTGQTSCYDNGNEITCPTSASADFFGQDAQFTSKCTAQSFTASSNVVIDNNTGLTWEKSLSSGTYTWYNRATHCNELNSSNYGGKSNWRVPNLLELLTIIDISNNQPATNSNFTGMPTSNNTYLWTDNEYKGNNSYAYFINPYLGFNLYNEEKTNTNKVLCVSGDELVPATLSDFTTSSDSKTVTDSQTGLMWQKEYITNKTWQQALKYCEDSTYAGYSDWRLPNKNELASLINYGIYNPASDFPDMPSERFWSSSTYGNGGNAWFASFQYGYVDYGADKTGNFFNVRCVR